MKTRQYLSTFIDNNRLRNCAASGYFINKRNSVQEVFLCHWNYVLNCKYYPYYFKFILTHSYLNLTWPVHCCSCLVFSDFKLKKNKPFITQPSNSSECWLVIATIQVWWSYNEITSPIWSGLRYLGESLIEGYND